MFLQHYGCISCDSSDGLALYENVNDDGDIYYSATCFATCQKSFQHNDLANSYLGDELGIEPIKRRGGNVAKQRKPVLDDDQIQEIEGNGGYDTMGYRKLSEAVNRKYGVITHYKDDEPHKRFYPVTEKGVLTGYKGRELPKTFFSKGRNDNQSDLFGQSLFPKGGKYLLIVGGEEDTLAGYEMLRMDQAARGKSDLPPVAVVSPTVGETSCQKQLQHNYEWIDLFDEIIVMFDNDEAGEEAKAKALEVLPMGKTRVANLPLKDPCDMKRAGREREFVFAFYNSKRENPAGIVGSSDLVNRIVERAMLQKVPLPPFATKLQKAMAGGIPLGYIINIAAASGQGKTTLINEFIYWWIFNSPYKVGIVSLESDPGEYGELLLSRHAGQKIALLETVEEKLGFLQSEHIQHAMNELFIGDDGDDRFHLLDHQGSVGETELKQKIEYLVRGLGCKLIIIDPLQLAMTGSDNEAMDEFMAWQKNFVSRHMCIIINITHIRKNSNDQKANSRGASISEESIKGSGSIFQVAGANILLMRDKENEDSVVRNTTKSVMSKCRWTGNTGPTGDWYYDNQKHTLYDFESYWNDQEAPDDALSVDADVLAYIEMNQQEETPF